MIVFLVVFPLVLVGFGYAAYAVAGLAASAFLSWGLQPAYGTALANVVFLMLVFVMLTATGLTIGERKWSALMQNRIGPNRIRPFGNPLAGLPYILADGLKTLTKENIQPSARSKFLYEMAPVISLAPAFALFAVIPVGPRVAVSGQQVALQVASPDAGLLYLFAIASLAVYGTSIAGWASNNKLAILGGVRASSQMISYEVSLGLSLVGAMMAYGTLRLEEMSVAQGKLLWGVLPQLGFILQPVGLVLFFASAFAETKRAPFDLPEGESEIVGYFVEYPGMKFAMMMLAEFIEVVVLAGVTVAVFLGGWHPIVFEGWLKANLSPLAFAAVCAGAFMLKTIALAWLQLVIRWTLPRFRFDQIQKLCWKMMLPFALANVFLTGALVLADPTLEWLAIVGIVEIVALVALTAAATKAPEPAHGEHGHGGAHAAPAHGH
ncbi:MAG: NADH-quinone oxidoreductase subunit H [Deltaproteobacteria bacterium]|nr:NADH-quinone oxidoreductase subunit H [Deltaproteobacteria bacterium]